MGATSVVFYRDGDTLDRKLASGDPSTQGSSSCGVLCARFTGRQLRRPAAAAPATGVIPAGLRRRLRPALARLVLVGHARL
eukprot:1211298-Prymnesium_polylepis.1